MRPHELAALRIHGWHGRLDALCAFVLVSSETDSRPIVRAYREGEREQRKGRPCGCQECVVIA